MAQAHAIASERLSPPAWLAPDSGAHSLPVTEINGQDRRAAEAQAALRDAAEAAAEAAAQARYLADRLDEAMAMLLGTEPAPRLALAPAVARWDGNDSLSPRERDVLALVAAGHSNKAIAAALFVSPNTVKTHVTSLLRKLGAESRVQLAAIATRRGLQSSSSAP
jgi:DNA-binding NarL/FixJ family response regulator